MSSKRKMTHRKATGGRKGRAASIVVEPLEGRALLATLYPTAALYPTATSPAATVTSPVSASSSPVSTSSGPFSLPSALPASVQQGNTAKITGMVSKSAHFYQAYTGPKLKELNAVKASGELSLDGNFTFTGTEQATINKAPAVFVWGIDRSGNLPAGTFVNRPNIKFDAVVVVTLNSSLTPSAMVTDLVSGTSTNLPAGSATVHGKTVSVTVPESLLPSTGLDPVQYRFNFWPEDGDSPSSSSVASFLPENTTVQVGAH
jgi:hypothetical protein